MTRPPTRATAGAPGEVPLVLGIETATDCGGVALVGASGLLGEVALRGVESHAERILPAAERLLAALALPLDAVAAVAVSAGPGSFTGLRTGIAAAKGLALARGVPLYGVPSLLALARNAPAGAGPVAALLDARRGEHYRALFRRGRAGLEPDGAEHLVATAALLAGLPCGCLVAGELPPDRALEATLRSLGAQLLPEHLRRPHAEVVAREGLARLARRAATELETLVPRYVRPPDAKAPAARGKS